MRLLLYFFRSCKKISTPPNQSFTERLHDVARRKRREGGARRIKPSTRTCSRLKSASQSHTSRPVMDIIRNIAHQPTSNSKMCEQSLNKSCEFQKKKGEEHSQGPSETSRIITDSATGKCYCRGKVLGKVNLVMELSESRLHIKVSVVNSN